MTYRAIYSDIDGTLLNRAHRMSPRTLAITRRLAQAGIPIILVSARPPLAITPFTDAIGGKQPLIAFNGALILDGDLNELYSVTLDDADLHRLETLLENDPALTSINYYQGTHWYSPDPDNFWTVQEGDITGLRATKRPATLANVHKILVMGDAPVIAALQERLKPQFPHLEIHRSKDEYLEIVNKRATKAQAIAFMGECLGVPAAWPSAITTTTSTCCATRATAWRWATRQTTSRPSAASLPQQTTKTASPKCWNGCFPLEYSRFQ